MSVIAVGREEKLYAVPESTYGAAASNAAAGNAVRFLSADFKTSEERIIRADKRATRSPLATIVKRLTADWQVEGYLLPSGAAGTAPDGWDDIFESGFGVETINVGTSVVYTLGKEFSKSLTFHRGIGYTSTTSVMGEMIRGCFVNQMNFSLSGSDPAMVTCSGFAADILRAGMTLSTATGTVTALTVTSGEAHNFDAGVYIDVDSDTGLLVSAVNTSTSTLTIPSTTVASGDVVMPSVCGLAQTFTSTAVPVSGILGSASLEGSSCDIISAQISVNNGAKPHNDKYGTNKVSQYSLGNREITGQITMRLQDDNFIRIAKSRRSSFIALSLVSGTVAGSIATFSLPNVLVDLTSVPSSPVDDIVVTLPFRAYASSGEDEMTLTLT